MVSKTAQKAVLMYLVFEKYKWITAEN